MTYLIILYLRKKYKNKKLINKLKNRCHKSLIQFAVEGAHNLDEIVFDDFFGILQDFDLSKLHEDKDKKEYKFEVSLIF